ncbi:MAG TPA: DUF4097 family beta strand repeat-containing protein [Bacteroidota bacterium]|nr:DUF4097 family beta strand repeat-containing protein [Bacteroidota bacterium]
MKALVLAAVASTMMLVNPEKHRDIDQHFSTTPSQKIEIRGFSGSRIKFRSWDKNEVSVRLDITFSSSNTKDEQRFLDAISLKEQQTSEVLRIEYEEPEMRMHGGNSFVDWLSSLFGGSFMRKEVEGEIYVPRSNPLSAEVRYGSVEMDGMKGSLDLLGTGNSVTLKNCLSVGEVRNEYGKSTFENCAGSLRLKSKSNNVVVDQFDGKVDIDAEYSNISVRRVTQPVNIHSASATIRVDDIKGDATIHSDYSTITVNNVKGMLEIRDRSGSIRAREMDGAAVENLYGSIDLDRISGKAGKEIVLKGQSGQITLTNASGDVRIDDPYGGIELNGIKGNIDVRSQSSSVRATGVTGDWTSRTQYCTISLREISAKQLTITNTGGRVDVSTATVPTSVDIKNEYERVMFEMPQGFGGDVDLNVTYGKIETNLPLSRKKDFDGGGGYVLGKMGNGNGKIAIETRSGNLNVMQR